MLLIALGEWQTPPSIWHHGAWFNLTVIDDNGRDVFCEIPVDRQTLAELRQNIDDCLYNPFTEEIESQN